MKIRHLFLVVIVLATVVTGWWWLNWNNNVSGPGPATSAKVSPKPVATPPATIAAPVFAPKSAPALSVSTNAVVATPAMAPAKPTPGDTAAAAASDPRTELATTLSDIALLMRNGDYMTFVKTYTPPQELAAMSPEELADRQRSDHNPQLQPMFDLIANAMDNLKEQIPTLNAASDQAIYLVEQPNSPDPQHLGPRPITFVKVDGHWYKEPTLMTVVDGKWYIVGPLQPKQ